MADLIVVLDGAHLVETGTHEALIARGGQYAQLYSIQAAAYARSEVQSLNLRSSPHEINLGDPRGSVMSESGGGPCRRQNSDTFQLNCPGGERSMLLV